MHKRVDETGAIAVLTALLVIPLLLLSAFVVDLGMAYNSKRQLQTAADAAALAAALTYADQPGTCEALVANTGFRTAAEVEADTVAAANRPGFDAGAITEVACNPDGELEVTYDVRGSTEMVFGKLAGGDLITTTRSASAVVDVPGSAREARPYLLCGAHVPTGPLPSAVVKVEQPGAGHVPPSTCPDTRRGGNWWTVDCPETGNNGTTDLADATLNGCEEPISIIADQEDLTGNALSSFLTGSCQARAETCLGANPGNLDTVQIDAAWQQLTARHEKLAMPTFCATPTCGPPALTEGDGNNTLYPVHKLVGVTVCGYHWGKNRFLDNLNGPCANNPGNHRANEGDNNDNYLLVVFNQIRVSGSTHDSDCALGDYTCDGGLRRVHLSK